MRRLLLLFALLVLAAVPQAAGAKQIDRVEVCGADGCQAVLKGSSNEDRHVLMDGGPQASAPKAPGPYFTIKVSVLTDQPGHHEVIRNRWFPKVHMLAARDWNSGETIWMTPYDSTIRAFDRAVRGIRPHPASALPASVLKSELPQARVHLVINPPDGGDDDGGGGPPGWALAAGGAVLVLGAAGLFVARRRRHGAAPGMTAASEG
jgi:hypothetical protein